MYYGTNEYPKSPLSRTNGYTSRTFLFSRYVSTHGYTAFAHLVIGTKTPLDYSIEVIVPIVLDITVGTKEGTRESTQLTNYYYYAVSISFRWAS